MSHSPEPNQRYMICISHPPPLLLTVKNEMLSDDSIAEIERTLESWRDPEHFNRVCLFDIKSHYGYGIDYFQWHASQCQLMKNWREVRAGIAHLMLAARFLAPYQINELRFETYTTDLEIIEDVLSGWLDYDRKARR
jgi:hypothetical protein